MEKKAIKETRMEYRALGKTGLSVSRLGLGGIPVQRTDAEGARALVGELLRHGVNFIDTARAYTVSEALLGEALLGVRDRFILATKSMARTREAMEADMAKSFADLRTDYIDLYQVHNPSERDLATVTAPGGALEALTAAKAAGRIGHIGITLHSAELFAVAVELPWVETIMFPYNLVETQGEELIAACAERGIAFIAMKPLAGGAIEDAATALRFIAQNPHVTVVIPGMAEVAEVERNAAAVADAAPLSEEELATVEKTRKTLGTSFCRRCGYCAPCTVGINIPAVFLFEGYHSRYDLKDWAQVRYATLATKASACIGCGACEARCPYHLPIRDMMKRAAATLEE